MFIQEIISSFRATDKNESGIRSVCTNKDFDGICKFKQKLEYVCFLMYLISTWCWMSWRKFYCLWSKNFSKQKIYIFNPYVTLPDSILYWVKTLTIPDFMDNKLNFQMYFQWLPLSFLLNLARNLRFNNIWGYKI